MPTMVTFMSVFNRLAPIRLRSILRTIYIMSNQYELSIYGHLKA